MIGTAGPVLLSLETAPMGWQVVAERVCRARRLSVQVDERSLLIWIKVQVSAGVEYADGWVLARTWLAPSRAGVSIRARRLYFRGGELDRRTETEIVGGRRPPAREVAEELENQRQIMLALAEALPMHPKLVGLALATKGLIDYRSVEIGESTCPFVSRSANANYKEHGFDRVPADWHVSVCPTDGVPTALAGTFANRLQALAAQRSAHLSASIITIQQVNARLATLNGQSPRQGRCVLFVLPQRNRPPSTTLAEVMRRMDEARIPYRRAYGDDPHDYSIPDQLPSILMACGGRPHRSREVDRANDVWQLAIDLGHAPGANKSVVVAALLDPFGELVHAARTWQPRDETAHTPSVQRLLSSCREAIGRTNRSCQGVLVIRDGRHFEHERLDAYAAHLDLPTTPIEFRKRGNPQMAWLRGAALEPVDVVAAKIPDTCSMFVSLASPRTGKSLPAIAKVAWDEAFNGLSLSEESIARLLATSAAAPGLGVHPHHLPGAVYWADGIASASDTDLRFRGVPCDTIQSP